MKEKAMSEKDKAQSTAYQKWFKEDRQYPFESGFEAGWKAHAASTDRLRAALESANALLRSAYVIADRRGDKTNWEGFEAQVLRELEVQHKILREAHECECNDGNVKVSLDFIQKVDEKLATLRTQLEAANAERDRLKQLVDAALRITIIAPDGQKCYISDRGTGAKGSWYVGRQHESGHYHEFIGNSGEWCSAAKVYKSPLDAYDSILSAAGEGKE
jgi:hypothetical protein